MSPKNWWQLIDGDSNFQFIHYEISLAVYSDHYLVFFYCYRLLLLILTCTAYPDKVSAILGMSSVNNKESIRYSCKTSRAVLSINRLACAQFILNLKVVRDRRTSRAGFRVRSALETSPPVAWEESLNHRQ